jgi:hypothetical protein
MLPRIVIVRGFTRVGQVVGAFSSVRETAGSNLDQRTATLIKDLCEFLQFLYKIPGHYLNLGHNRFCLFPV